MSDFFDRQELIAIRERAESLAETNSLNPRWRRALFALADAADRLDALIKRTEMGDQSPGDIGAGTLPG